MPPVDGGATAAATALARWASGAVFFLASTAGFLGNEVAILDGGGESSSLELDRLAGFIDDIVRLIVAAFWAAVAAAVDALLL